MIGKNIKTRREQIGITQQQLADKVKIDRSMISKLEKSKAKPSFNTLESIAEALNISISELVENNESLKKENKK